MMGGRVPPPGDDVASGPSDDRKAIERGLDLAEVWESTEPHSLMSRRRAAAILREVLDP